MFRQTFSLTSFLALYSILVAYSEAAGEGDLKEKVTKLVETVKEKLGLDEEELGPEEVKNWMNSFLQAKIRYGTENGEQKAQEFNVIFDSVFNFAQHPINFVLFNCPAEKNADGKKAACKRHKMQLFQSANAKEISQGEVTTINGLKLKMKIVETRMEYDGTAVQNAKLMLLDGTDFKLFDPMLDSGAPGGPQMDGVFSMAIGDGEFRSGMEQLLVGKTEKVATMYMQPFADLDFFSKTRAKLSIGHLNRTNCAFAEPVEWLGIVQSTPKRWKIGMEVKVIDSNGTQRPPMTNQQVLISTSDIFIFAPSSVTKPLMENLTLVKDNKGFQVVRMAGKTGVGMDFLSMMSETDQQSMTDPKDVLIKEPTKEQWAKLPTFEFKIGKQTFTLKPEEYVLPLKAPLNPITDEIKFPVFNWWHPLIRERPETGMYAKYVLPENNTDQWVFGQLFFNKACVAFKYGDAPQVALAPTINASPPK